MPAEAVLRSLRHVWLTLEPLELPMAVIGGIALATWKYVRATRDVDLLLGIAEYDLNDVLDRLRAAEIRPKHDPPVTTVGQLDVIQLLYEPPETFLDLQIDLLLARSAYHLDALKRRIPTQLPDLDIEIAVLACEDLILHKLMAGRIIDRVDSAALLRANRGTLNLDDLVLRARALGISEEYTEVWNDVFPGEPVPEVEDES